MTEREPPLVTDAEVAAAQSFLDEAAKLARRSDLLPPTIIRCMLEAAARVRHGECVPTSEDDK